MDEAVKMALASGRTIDITTTGRKSGQPKRIEIWFHNRGGRLYITGTPGKRDWYANLRAHPDFTFHLKESVKADLPARARLIENEAERRTIFSQILPTLGSMNDLDAWMKDSPLVEVTILEP